MVHVLSIYMVHAQTHMHRVLANPQLFIVQAKLLDHQLLFYNLLFRRDIPIESLPCSYLPMLQPF